MYEVEFCPVNSFENEVGSRDDIVVLRSKRIFTLTATSITEKLQN